jgi:flagellar biosynthesis component FlhA
MAAEIIALVFLLGAVGTEVWRFLSTNARLDARLLKISVGLFFASALAAVFGEYPQSALLPFIFGITFFVMGQRALDEERERTENERKVAEYKALQPQRDAAALQAQLQETNRLARELDLEEVPLIEDTNKEQA